MSSTDRDLFKEDDVSTMELRGHPAAGALGGARRGCLVRVGGQRCPERARWDLLLVCSGGCHGGGPACDAHRDEAAQGTRHNACGGVVTLATAVPL